MKCTSIFKITMVLAFCTVSFGRIFAQNNQSQTSLYNFSFAGVKGLCDSTINEKWDTTGGKGSWKLSDISVYEINSKGYMDGIKGYGDSAKLAEYSTVTRTSSNKVTRADVFYNLALFKLGTGFIDYTYIAADTNANGWVTTENTYVADYPKFKTYTASERYIYTYDSKGKMIGSHKLVWNKSAWEDKSADSFTYNSSDQLISDSAYSQNSTTKVLEFSNRKTYKYDANGKVNYTADEIYQPSTKSMYYSYRINYVHDASGNRTSSFEENYDQINKVWNNGGVDTTKYDAITNYSSTITYNYDLKAKKYVYSKFSYCGIGIVAGAPIAPSGLKVTAIKKTNDKKLQLSWTDNSNNESGFIIYRSTDGTNYSVIDSAAANATSYLDTALAPNTTFYYQVAAWNASGVSSKTTAANAVTYSGIAANIEATEFNIFPNPSTGTFNLTFSKGTGEETSILMRDELGKVVYSSKLASGTQSMQMDLNHLSKGMYILSLTGANYNSIHKLIIER